MLWLNEVGSWLVHSSVFGAIILLMGGLAVWLFREPVYRVRIIHWTFVACLLVPLLQQVDLIPSYSLNVWQQARSNDAAELVANNDSESTAVMPAQPYEAGGATDATLAPPDATPVRRGVTVPREADDPRAAATQVATSPPNRFAFFPIAISAVQIAYLALVGYLLLAWIVGLVRRNAIEKHAKPAEEALRHVLASIAGPRAQYARLLVSDRLDGPIMWGLWRPTIVVPTELAIAKDSAQLRWGLAHEWSHVARRDIPTLLVASLAKLVCFYQPAYWWLRRQLTLSQDYVADAFAAKHGKSAEDYAAFLVSLARARNRPTLAGTLGIVDHRSNLFRRINMLVRSTRPLLPRVKRLPAFVITLIALLTVGGLSAVRLSAVPIDDPPNATVETEETKVEGPGGAEDKAPPKDKATDQQAKKLPEPITYTGKVIDRETGGPIAGATVEVTHELSRDPETSEWTTLHTTTHKSDENGHYSFTLPPEEVAQPSLYLVVNAHHREYQSKGRSGYSHAMIRKNLANGEPPFYATIKLSAGEAISAVVLQPDGTPAANTRVLAYSKGPPKDSERSFERGAFQHSPTDENGRFRIVVATPGDGVVWVFPKNFSPIAQRIGGARGDIGPMKLKWEHG